MLEEKTAEFAAAKPRAKAAAPRAKATVTKAAGQAAAGRSAVPRRPKYDMYERIQRRAYELWESEGRPNGREQANWLQAEAEIAGMRGQRAGAGY
jgi:hypothetical protein